ncbi:hypothetical protein ABFS83_14G218300 [Erythranthe nasuta]
MKWPSLAYLNLGNNMLSGSIPNSIGFLRGLRYLNLYNNTISGQIPFAMHHCTSLIKIDLANNDIDGSLPTWMGTRLPNLRILVLDANQLRGNISSEICHLNSLQILDLSDSKFSGIIPRCVHNFTAMATKRSDLFIFTSGALLESASVITKGREFRYDTILGLVTNIDLSKNNLSGDIPNELMSLVELRSLNLSGNHFTGLIPQTIGDMKQLESLDLSRNSLSGEMPNSFKVMSALNFLNVSYNHLTGRIPESTQLQGFDNSSFIGNDLCGLPLTSNCSSGGPTNKDDNESDNHKSKIEWLYVFMSLGYAVGLSVFCTTLVLKKSWREAYYEFLEDIWNKVYVYCHIKWRRLTTKPSGSVPRWCFCDNITGHVRQLHLQFSGLSGKIDLSFLNLKHLRYLDLSQNNFEQTIPSFIGSLTSLEYLNLSHAGFYGTVPHSIGNLLNIHTLNLEINYYGSQLDVNSLEWVSTPLFQIGSTL